MTNDKNSFMATKKVSQYYIFDSMLFNFINAQIKPYNGFIIPNYSTSQLYYVVT